MWYTFQRSERSELIMCVYFKIRICVNINVNHGIKNEKRTNILGFTNKCLCDFHHMNPFTVISYTKKDEKTHQTNTSAGTRNVQAIVVHVYVLGQSGGRKTFIYT